LLVLGLFLVLALSAPAQVNLWTSGFDGAWEDGGNWLLGPPDATQSAVLVTNAGSKTVTIDFITAGFFPETLTISNLTLSAPIGSINTLSLLDAGTDVPLEVLNGFLVARGGNVQVNNSTVQVDGLSGGGFTIDGEVTVNGGTIIAPAVIVSPSGASQSALTLAGGTLTADALVLTNSQGQVNFLAGTLAIQSTSVSNNQPFTVGDGADAAVLELLGGTHSFADGLQISSRATLTGEGTINADLSCAGVIDPGIPTGGIFLNGNCALQDAAALHFDLGGYAQEIDHDFIYVNGIATLAGTLAVSFVNGFQNTVTNGSRFVVLGANFMTGVFGNVADGARLTTTDGFGDFRVNYFSNSLLLSDYRRASPPGDVNGDSKVSAADSLLIDQVLVGLRSSTSAVFQANGFQNGDVNAANGVNGADSLLINQVLVGLRAYATSKILPDSHSSNQATAVTIYGIGFPTNTVSTNDELRVTIGAPVNLTLSNVIAISHERITGIVPAGGGLGTGAVNVVSSPTNGVISFGKFVNQ
jgi:hypothetical protein